MSRNKNDHGTSRSMKTGSHHVRFKDEPDLKKKQLTGKPAHQKQTLKENQREVVPNKGAARQTTRVRDGDTASICSAADITTKTIEVANLKVALEKYHEEIEGVPATTLSYQDRSKRLTNSAKIMQFCRQYLKQRSRCETSHSQDGFSNEELISAIIEPAMEAWLTAYKEEEYLRIRKAVQLDKFEPIPGTHITTSVVDVAQSFMMTAMEWRALQWQQISVQYCVRLAVEFAELADLYAHELHDSLQNKDYESKSRSIKQFDLTDKVCLVINDIETMHQHLNVIIKRKKFLGLQDPGAIVEAMEDDIENQIADIANTVANMMREHLAEKLFAIPQKLKEDTSCAFDDFTGYLEGDIYRVISMINPENQKRLLGSIRDIVMKELVALLRQELKRHRINGDVETGKEHYTELLRRCEGCFAWSGEGDVGLNSQDLEHCKQRDFILWLMEIHQLSTDDVISKYMDYKIDVQSNDDMSCGTLMASLSFHQDTKILIVSHLCCDNFLQMYSDGTSDVFVRIGLYPPHLFPKQTFHQTKTKTDAPRHASFESEIFEILVPEEVCKADASLYLHFTLLNRHRPWPLSSEEIIGEGYFKYTNLCADSNQDAVVHLTLPSYKPGQAGDTIDILKGWSDQDKVAARFVKLQRKLAESCNGVFEKYTRARLPCFQTQ